MRLVMFIALLLAATFWGKTADAEPLRLPIEQEVAALTAAPEVTIVHFWASWCPNCRAEHVDEGWKRFVAANPDVKVIFISIWGSDEDDARVLAQYGLAEQANFIALRHPNQARRNEERVTQFLDLPITWIPTTWIYRGGHLRYALNYGEVRFPVLQQLVNDARPQ